MSCVVTVYYIHMICIQAFRSHVKSRSSVSRVSFLSMQKLLCFSLNFFSVFFFLHVGDNNVNKVKSRELTERFRCVSVDRNQREFLDSWGIWDPFFFYIFGYTGCLLKSGKNSLRFPWFTGQLVNSRPYESTFKCLINEYIFIGQRVLIVFSIYES